jgi:hypothetical protein
LIHSLDGFALLLAPRATKLRLETPMRTNFWHDGRMRTVLVLVALACALAASQTTASAQPRCDPAQTDRIVKALRSEVQAADQWAITWATIFGAAAVVQVGFAVSHVNPLGPNTDNARRGLYIGAAKATIGFLARTVTPLRVATVSQQALDASSNECQRYQLAYRSVMTTARREKNSFYLGHFGGLALHIIGAGILLANHGGREAITSFAVGYPVGLIHNYLMPRISWKLSRHLAAPSVSWLLMPTVSADGGGLTMIGTF